MADLLFGTAERIIETLGSPGRLRWGFEDELQSLMNTVSKIKAVLLDAVEKQAESHAVRDWFGKLSDAIYEADDLVDAISADALRRQIMIRDKKAKKVRIFFSISNQFAFRLRMSHKIKAIRRRLDDIDAEREIFNLEVRDVETRVGVENRETHSFVHAEEVFGREDDKKTVIDRLLDSNVAEKVSILPIVGIGGIGKTTLAQLIFNDEQIQRYFEPKMWVYVSDPFHVRNVVVKIFEAATKTRPETVDMETLAGKIKEKIDGKRYFLVLDDMWNEDHEKWSKLREVLMGGARGSSILVTTRSQIVARISRTVQPYYLWGLHKDASWSLFKQNAFQRGQELENSSIVELGREILEKCEGVPLIIRTIGSLLRSKNPETEWLPFKNKELSKMFETEKDPYQTLKLSYDQLPSHLKHCFAYCSLFPHDYEIDKSTLIQLWIAQGFVKLLDQKPHLYLEDVGNEYVVDLLRRAFFQEAEIDEFGKVMRYKMHDLMHDLAILMGGSLIATLDNYATNVDEKTRHVSFGCDINSSVVQTVLKKESRIRTFLYLGGNHFEAEINCDEIFKSFKFLRVLDMHERDIDIVPSSIGKLKHLRYLDLSRNCNIKKLPDSITKLQNLQTLKLSKCGSLKELPGGIKRLVNLRHLEVDGCYGLTYMPRGLGQLTKLQTLSTFVVHLDSHSKHSGGLRELSRLNNLRGELVIENLEHGNGVASECKAANLKEKRLHALHLWWSSQTYANDSDVEDEVSLECFQPHPNLKHLRLGKYQGSRLPYWLLSLTNLVRFELYWCKKCQYLPPLSQLPSLKHLLLISLDAMEYISDSDSNEFSSSSVSMPIFFPSLNEISLWGCRNLKGWWRGDSFVEGNNDSHDSDEITEHPLVPCFPCLSKLAIQYCPKLTSMPMFPHLEEELVLVDASSKPLQQTMMMNMAALQSPTLTATASSSVTPLSKLKSIQLDSIPDLETLPEGIRWLTSLQRLTIVECPILLQRCKRDTGEDWAKIAHIPDLNLQ